MSSVKRNKTAPMVLQHEFEKKSSPSSPPPPLQREKATITPPLQRESTNLYRTQTFHTTRKSIVEPQLPRTKTSSVISLTSLPTPVELSPRPSYSGSRRNTKKEEEPLVLPSLDRRQSVYLQIAAVVKNPEILNESSESDNESNDINSTPRPKAKRRMSKSRASFMAWVANDKPCESPEVPQIQNSEFKFKRKENTTQARRSNFQLWLTARDKIKQQKEAKERGGESSLFLTETSPDTCDQYQPIGSLTIPPIGNTDSIAAPVGKAQTSFSNVGKIMKNSSKNIEDRMKDFYGTVNKLKVIPHEGGAPSKEKKRRWKLLMKGVKAALADSSDEDDDTDK